MKTAEEVRRLRLLELKRQFGSYSKLNELLGRSSTDATLSQIANRAADSKTGKPRTMGAAQARALERACKKEEGWMDVAPTMVDLQYIDLLPPPERANLEGLFGRLVLTELTKLGIAIPQKNEDAGSDDLSQVRRKRV